MAKKTLEQLELEVAKLNERILKMKTEAAAKAYGEELVERVNMMSGKKFFEARNTPSYCSPASEAYWSM